MAADWFVVGLGTSHLLMDAWNPEPTSVLFGGVWAGQMGIAMSELYPLQVWNIHRVGSDSRLIQQWREHCTMTIEIQFLMSRVYFQRMVRHAGYLLGYGVNNLSQGDGDDGSRNAALLSTVATVGGTTIGNTMNFTPSDWVTTGVGLGLTGWHMGSIATICTRQPMVNESSVTRAGSNRYGCCIIGAFGDRTIF